MSDPGRIHRLSLPTNAAIRRVERESYLYGIFPGRTAAALHHCCSFFPLPGRTLRPGLAGCPCHGCPLDDATHARDVLGDIASALAPRPQAELGRRIARLDAQLLRCPPADPRAPGHPWRRKAGWGCAGTTGSSIPPRRLR
ncbi:hypothetical protein ACWD7C_00850 [Streptomyces sp. NPDC005134]|uniref:hypothetical protein n=1 Tax=Streptomyces sp. NPDC005098 TaxID=3154560 RepID=UPI0033A73031